jgi:hypothetical protein
MDCLTVLAWMHSIAQEDALNSCLPSAAFGRSQN